MTTGMSKEKEWRQVELLAKKIRRDTLAAIKHMGQGHLGGSLSIVELLAVLYGKQLSIDPTDPLWEARDRVVLSKGHAGVALYSALANVGYFDRSLLQTLNEGGTSLPSHPDRNKTPGVDATTGSLGQGTSMAAGAATGLKLSGINSYVYLIVGDGELNEGQCWEAFQYIAHAKLDNCLVIIDENKKQLDGTTEDILHPFDLAKKMNAFGFNVRRVKGDDLSAIDAAIQESKRITDEAICIILDSIKGQGIPYFEQMKDNHSVKFNNEEVNQAAEMALAQLELEIEEMTT